ncbi:MAG: ion transporter [Merismopediaceae bacterium]|nr:ion transporter [Merismopediaceae bacterium]
MANRQTLRQQTALIFEKVNTPIEIAINFAILALSILSLTIFVVQTYDIPEQWRSLLNELDTFILICFTFEYLLRLWSAPSRLKFIVDFYSLIDLISVLPLFLIGFDVRFFRILRWFRLLKIIRLANNDLFAVKFKIKDQVIFIRIYLILFSTIFIYSGLIYQIEHPQAPEIFGNFFDALYYCVVTMTTVGFGDITPLSDTGRMLTIIMIITGIILIPWQVGDLVKQLLKVTNQVNTLCDQCGLVVHDSDANYCKSCGAKLRKIDPTQPQLSK